eukprot:COSAG04_NODE_6680_length_1279_cov_1.072881_2_plen_164_part_01
MVRWHRDFNAEYGDCSFICTILFAESAAEDMGSEAPKTAKKVHFLPVISRAQATLRQMMPHTAHRGFTEKGVLKKRREPRPPGGRSAFRGASPGRRRREGAVWCAARPRRRTNAREQRRIHRRATACAIAASPGRSFDLEVTPWAPPRLTSCIFHPGPEEAYEP